jgi:hypothetical protein
MDLVVLSASRRQLIQAGLIAYEKPFYRKKIALSGARQGCSNGSRT